MNRLLIALIYAPVAATWIAAAQAQSKPNKSMTAGGSFHRAHVNRAKLDCDTCHEAKSQVDMLVLSTNRTHSAKLPAPVDPAACLVCHQGDGKFAWYGKMK